MPVVVCIPAIDQSKILTINVPGVGELRALKDKLDNAPTPYNLAATLLGQVSPMLAPITQILRIVDVVVSLYKALSDLTGPTKFPAFVKAIIALAKKIGALSTFIPGLAYVKLGRDIINLLAAIFHGFETLISRWVTEIEQIAVALDTAAIINDGELTGSATCSKGRLIEVQTAANITLQDIGQILKLLEFLFNLVKPFVPGGALSAFLLIPAKVIHAITGLAASTSGLHDANTPTAIRAQKDQLLVLSSEFGDIATALDSISAALSIAV